MMNLDLAELPNRLTHILWAGEGNNGGSADFVAEKLDGGFGISQRN